MSSIVSRAICHVPDDIRDALVNPGAVPVNLSLEHVSAADCAGCLSLLAGTDLSGVGSLRFVDCALQPSDIPALAAALRSYGGIALSADAGDAQAEDGDQDGTDVFCMDFDSLMDGDVAAAETPEVVSVGPRPTIAQSESRSLALVGCTSIAAEAWAVCWREMPSGLAELDLSRSALSDHAVNALCVRWQDAVLLRA